MAVNNVVLETTETEIITSSTGQEVAILSIMFCNTSTGVRTITCYAYPSTGAASNGTTFIQELEIDSGDTFIWTAGEKFLLGSEDTITGLADVGDSVTVTINSYNL